MQLLNNTQKVLERLNWEIKFIMNKGRINYLSNTGRKYSIYYRQDTSDQKVLSDIFYSNHYSFDNLKRNKDIQNKYSKLLAENKTPLIIDAGANIGASAIWFKDQFPTCHLVAIEPEDNNFKILKQNTNDLGIELKHAAIGSISSKATISNLNSADNWAFQTKYDNSGPINVISVSSIIEENSGRNLEPFIIKIDIEGFESDLFSKNTEWIDQFYVIIVELHDWMLPMQGSSKSFLTSIAGKDRDFIQRADNIFSVKN